jgi:hypothetical protein
MSNNTFTRIPIITPYYRGDNLLYKKKYGYLIGTILHDLELFNKASNQEKHDAFSGLYLFSIISVHMDLITIPRGLKNARNLKNKIYIITNIINQNPIIQELGILYLEIKLLKENNYKLENNFNHYKNLDNLLNILDDTLIYIIHIILSYNYIIIKEYIHSYNINDLPNIIIDLSLILSKIDKDINNSFYQFDPIINFNEYGCEIIPEHHELFYEGSIVRNFRNITQTKNCDYNFKVINNKHIIEIIDNIKAIKFKK